MDLFNVRAVEVTKLAMDGLVKRQSAIASNTANAMTPDYQRKQVAFEDQLREIIAKDDVRRDLRMQNSLEYAKDNKYQAGYTSNNANPLAQNIAQRLPQEQFMYIQQTREDTQNYAPEVIKDTRWIDYGNGNNVNVEEEMMSMAKTGSQYNVLATVEGRFMSGLLDVVKGGGA